MGGGLSDGERLSSDLDLFISPDQAVEIARAVAQLFAELGNREHRGVSRMRYLVQSSGPRAFAPSSSHASTSSPGRRDASFHGLST